MPAASDPSTAYAWWSSLRPDGLFIDDKRLYAAFPPAPTSELSFYSQEQLRRVLAALQENPADQDTRRKVIDTVFSQLTDLSSTQGSTWLAGPQVGAEWATTAATGERIKPQRLWSCGDVHLPVFIDPEKRVGVGRSRRSISRMLEWMRARRIPLGLITNAHQWRLVYAGPDHHASREWNSQLWLEEGTTTPQVDALRILLSTASLAPADADQEKGLLHNILQTRKGQSELSKTLGENVRTAVELLIKDHGDSLSAIGEKEGEDPLDPKDIYVAGCRVIMRLVFVLFSEARDLFPRGNPIYFDSYSLSGLTEQLSRQSGSAGSGQMSRRYSAWPRVLSLFQLVYHGSHHADITLRAYGGDLFRPGAEATGWLHDRDGIRRAIHHFETAALQSADGLMPDESVHQILQLLTRSVESIRGVGRVVRPVDFSDLGSEYIGILYEGLLDYELRTASDEDGAVLFLNLGDQPALPLSRLEEMDDKSIKNLIEKFKSSSGKKLDAGDDEPAEEEDDEPEEKDEEELPTDEAEAEDAAILEDDQLRQRVQAWARRAVDVGKLVKKSRARGAAAQAENEARIAAAARAFIARTIAPGEWFLVRWGGTRKGAGSYYTRPGLAKPTIRRTLEPLAHTTAEDGSLVPRLPEEILQLRVCDPAMGSGSFLAGALRYLTGVLYQSLFHHHVLTTEERQGREVIVPAQEAKEGTLLASLLQHVRLAAIDDHERLQAHLKRYVVEDCLYGVDLDPLAVELGKLALWVETMDQALPFSFLDHKLRTGNALVGCWFDRFEHYPLMAWEREGGDKGHTRYVHHHYEKVGRGGKVSISGEVWTDAIKAKKATVKSEMATWIEENAASPRPLSIVAEGSSPVDLQKKAAELASALHRHFDPAKPLRQRDEFRSLQTNYNSLEVRRAFDRWCAIWFWPADQLEVAPTPANFYRPPEGAAEIIKDLTQQHRFFHWELEFPEIFNSERHGFDAVLGNPPWETIQPQSKEWFSNVDPLFRAYGKQDALQVQTNLFTDNESIESAWLTYNAESKALANFFNCAGFAFGDPAESEKLKFNLRNGKQNLVLHESWRRHRAGSHSFTQGLHPFRHQGSGKPYLQKLFTELGHAVLKDGGRLGLIVPSGIYSDNGTQALRRLLLDSCSWDWLFCFENREKVFDIDSRFKFCPILATKGGTTNEIQTAFMRRNLDDWENAEVHALAYPRELVDKFSPFSSAIVEIRDPRDITILDKMYSNGVLLGDESEDGWGIKYKQGDFNMTSDSKLFPPLPKWEAKGYQPDEYGHWLLGKWKPAPADTNILTRDEGLILSRDGTQAIHVDDVEDIALPLYEGRMIGQFDYSEKGWVSGKGRSAVWRDIPWEEKQIEPQYLMANEIYRSENNRRGQTKVSFMDVTSATNSRSMIVGEVPDLPCGNKVPNFSTQFPAPLTTALGSLAYDFSLRCRLGGLSLNYYILEETPLPPVSQPLLSVLNDLTAKVTRVDHIFAASWWSSDLGLKSYSKRWALTKYERLRIKVIADALLLYFYGLDSNDLMWLFKGCDFEVEKITDRKIAAGQNPKGFWRLEKSTVPELRHTVLAQVAFADLQDKDLEAFLSQNDGEGWMIPETLRLADYGLGHDDRAKKHQPVASVLGPRFYDWQLEKSAEESWAECEAHARNLDLLFATQQPQTESAEAPQPEDPEDPQGTLNL